MLFRVVVGVDGVDDQTVTVRWREGRRVRGHRTQRILAGEPAVVIDDGCEHEPLCVPGRIGDPVDEGPRRPGRRRCGPGRPWTDEATEPPHDGRRPDLVDHARRVGHRRGRLGQVPDPQADGVAALEEARSRVEDEVGHLVWVHHQQVHVEGEVRRTPMCPGLATILVVSVVRRRRNRYTAARGAPRPFGGRHRLRHWTPRTGRRCSALLAWWSARHRGPGPGFGRRERRPGRPRPLRASRTRARAAGRTGAVPRARDRVALGLPCRPLGSTRPAPKARSERGGRSPPRKPAGRPGPARRARARAMSTAPGSWNDPWSAAAALTLTTGSTLPSCPIATSGHDAASPRCRNRADQTRARASGRRGATLAAAANGSRRSGNRDHAPSNRTSARGGGWRSTRPNIGTRSSGDSAAVISAGERSACSNQRTSSPTSASSTPADRTASSTTSAASP